MLLQRFQVFLLVLLLVTILHHIAKDRVLLVRPVGLPNYIRVHSHIRLPNQTVRPIASLLLETDPTVMYAFHPIRSKLRRVH